MTRLNKRPLTHEIQHGYPGFAYHQATTVDATHATQRFLLRQTSPPTAQHPWGQWSIVMRTQVGGVDIVTYNRRPRSWLGRLFKSWNR